jgi:hypothetical protein
MLSIISPVEKISFVNSSVVLFSVSTHSAEKARPTMSYISFHIYKNVLKGATLSIFFVMSFSHFDKSLSQDSQLPLLRRWAAMASCPFGDSSLAPNLRHNILCHCTHGVCVMVGDPQLPVAYVHPYEAIDMHAAALPAIFHYIAPML